MNERKLFTLSRTLGAVALLLALAALFGDPYAGASRSAETVDLATLSRVEPVALAREIVEGRMDLRVLDLRGEGATAEIVGAEKVPVGELATRSFAPTDRIVLVADEPAVAEEAAILLQRKGLEGVRLLAGGGERWESEVLHPVLVPDASPKEIADFRILRGISLQLGGEPVGGEDLLVDTAKPRPKLELPAAAAVPAGGAKRRKEGC